MESMALLRMRQSTSSRSAASSTSSGWRLPSAQDLSAGVVKRTSFTSLAAIPSAARRAPSHTCEGSPSASSQRTHVAPAAGSEREESVPEA